MAADEIQNTVPQYRFIYWTGAGCLLVSLNLLFGFQFIYTPKLDFARYQAVYSFGFGGFVPWVIGFRCALETMVVLRQRSRLSGYTFPLLLLTIALIIVTGGMALVLIIVDALTGR